MQVQAHLTLRHLKQTASSRLEKLQVLQGLRTEIALQGSLLQGSTTQLCSVSTPTTSPRNPGKPLLPRGYHRKMESVLLSLGCLALPEPEGTWIPVLQLNLLHKSDLQLQSLASWRFISIQGGHKNIVIKDIKTVL